MQVTTFLVGRLSTLILAFSCLGFWGYLLGYPIRIFLFAVDLFKILNHCFKLHRGPCQSIAYCGETSAWPGTCANFNPTNLAPPKHHARLRCASFGWHVLQRKSYPHGQAMPQKHWSKNAKVLGQKKLCWKCWGKKSLRWTRKSHIGRLLPRDVSLHDCRHIEIDA